MKNRSGKSDTFDIGFTVRNNVPGNTCSVLLSSTLFSAALLRGSCVSFVWGLLYKLGICKSKVMPLLPH